MFKAYVRRLNGQTSPVQWLHSGQHIGVHDGSVRLARLYWDQRNAGLETQDAMALLLSTVPLVDTLILTRQDPRQGERVVFHGLVTEGGTDGATVSLIAVDNPKADRLFDQQFDPAGPLLPTDQAPVAPFQSPPPPAQSGPVPLGQAGPVGLVPFTGQGPRPLSQVPDPAARPPAPPAGQQAAPAPSGWVPAGRVPTKRHTGP